MQTILVSAQFDGFLRYVLRFDSVKKEFVSHLFNEQDGGYYYGRYYDSPSKALSVYQDRCYEKRVEPIDALATKGAQDLESVPIPTQEEFDERTAYQEHCERESARRLNSTIPTRENFDEKPHSP